jgi:hypothetical protein
MNAHDHCQEDRISGGNLDPKDNRRAIRHSSLVRPSPSEGTSGASKRLGAPADLAACHTAQVAGYVVEGHILAPALVCLLAEKPDATGLAVSGMPQASRPSPVTVSMDGAKRVNVSMDF